MAEGRLTTTLCDYFKIKFFLVLGDVISLSICLILALWRQTQRTAEFTLEYNRSILSCPKSLYQSEDKHKAIDMKRNFILIQIKLTFTRKVMHLLLF